MTISEVINEIKDQLAASVPGLLTAAGVADFDEYEADTPTDETLLTLAVYYGDGERDDSMERRRYVVQLQLPSVDTKTSWIYQQSVIDALEDIDPETLDFESRSRISDENLPVFENDSTIVFIVVEYENSIDDCY